MLMKTGDDFVVCSCFLYLGFFFFFLQVIPYVYAFQLSGEVLYVVQYLMLTIKIIRKLVHVKIFALLNIRNVINP